MFPSQSYALPANGQRISDYGWYLSSLSQLESEKVCFPTSSLRQLFPEEVSLRLMVHKFRVLNVPPTFAVDRKSTIIKSRDA